MLQIPTYLFALANGGSWDRVFHKCSVANNLYDVNGTFGTDKVTLLHMAAQQGNVVVGKRLMQMGANPHAEDANTLLAIHHAAYNGHADFCAALPGTCLARQSTSDYTILSLACVARRGDTDEIQARRCRLICWLLEQPECNPNHNVLWLWRQSVHNCVISHDNVNVVEAAFERAQARQRRWTAPRAAWLAACVV